MFSSRVQERDINYYFENVIFKALWNGEAKDFSLALRSTLYFMYVKELLNFDTIRKFDRVLALDRGWDFLRKNPDGTFSSYVNKVLWDTFDPVELLTWIVKNVLEDEMFSTLNESHDVVGMKKMLSNVKVPIMWEVVYDSIEHIDQPVFTDMSMYWTSQNASGSYAIYRALFDMELPMMLDLDNARIVFDGVSQELMYIKETSCLYSKIYGIDAILCYDIANEEKTIIYRAELIGTSNDGRVWFADEHGRLNAYYIGEKKAYRMTDFGCEYRVNCDGTVTVTSSDLGFRVFAPYQVHRDGTYMLSSRHDRAKYIWQLIINAVCKKGCLKLSVDFSDQKRKDELYCAPYPFSIKEIKNRMDILREHDWIRKKKYESFVALLDLLGVEGIDRMEDITILLYKLWRCQRLSVKRCRKEDIFNKAFCDLIYSIADTSDFISRLQKNPDALLGDNLYWTSERKKKYSERIKNSKTPIQLGHIEKGKIGSFTVLDGALIGDLDYVYNGKVAEEIIVNNNIHTYDGKIFFDRRVNEYIATGENKKFEFLNELRSITGIPQLIYKQDLELWEKKFGGDKEEEEHWLDEEDETPAFFRRFQGRGNEEEHRDTNSQDGKISDLVRKHKERLAECFEEIDEW